MYIPDPLSMQLPEWADAVAYALLNYPNVTPLQGGNWQAWGMMFFNDPSLNSLGPPNPYAFTDWQLWGEQLVASLNSAPGSPTNPFLVDATDILTETPANGVPLMTESGLDLMIE